MNGDDIGQLVYLGMLLLVLGSYFFMANRQRLGETARQASLWGLIFIGAIVGFGMKDQLGDALFPSQSVAVDSGQIEVPRGPDGHYHLTLTVGQTPVDFLVDTGATDVVLSLEDARKVGIDTDALIYSGRASTANGVVRTARVRLADVAIDGFPEGSLRASVNEGALNKSLLGMSYLERFDRIEIQRDTLILSR